MTSTEHEAERPGRAPHAESPSLPAVFTSVRMWGLPAVLWLLLASTGVYLGNLSGPLIFDDEQTLTTNPTLNLGYPQVLHAPRETPMAGRPLPNVSFALGRALLGDAPADHHAVNLALHLLVALLGFCLLRTTLTFGRVPAWVSARADGLAFATALLFSVHPIGVEIVLYTTQRTESLMAVFYLSALLLLARAAVRRTVRPLDLVLTSLCCLLGTCSKEVFVTIPLLALFYDRAFFAGTFAAALRARSKLYVLLWLSFLPALALQAGDPRPASVGPLSLDYLLVQARLVPEYLGHALWPTTSVLDFGPLLPQGADTTPPLIALTLLLVALSTLLAFRRPQLGFLGVVVFGLLAPSSSIFTIHTEVGAERRIYLALFVILAYALVGAGLWLDRVLRSEAARSTAPVLLLTAVVVAFGVQARAYASTFESLESAWFNAVQARPENPRAHYNLGETYRRLGRADLAEPTYRAALERNEAYPDAHANLGNLLLALGRMEEGVVHLERAAQLAGRDARAQYNYGVALALRGDHFGAEQQLLNTLALAPHFPGAREKLERLRALQEIERQKRLPFERLGAQVEAVPWRSMTLFAPRGSWVGADAAYSVDLRDGRTLWLWGDTFIDPKADGSRENGPNFFVRNGCSIYSSSEPMTFYFGPEKNGVPSSCLHDVDGAQRWLWPLHGARLPSGALLLFRMHVRASERAFGFALHGWDAVAIEDPSTTPDQWKPRVVAALTTAPRMLVGTSVLVHGEHLYAYAVRNDPAQPQSHAMFLARYALASLAKLPAGALDVPEWWCGERGFASATVCPEPAALFDDGQVEHSVHYDPMLGRFVQVQMRGLFLSDPSTALVVRTAPQPQGPWTEPYAFYRPPEAQRADAENLVAYAAKAHPSIHESLERLLVTYVVNDLKHMPPDDELYYPRPVLMRMLRTADRREPLHE